MVGSAFSQVTHSSRAFLGPLEPRQRTPGAPQWRDAIRATDPSCRIEVELSGKLELTLSLHPSHSYAIFTNAIAACGPAAGGQFPSANPKPHLNSAIPAVVTGTTPLRWQEPLPKQPTSLIRTDFILNLIDCRYPTVYVR
jgi:hypothetical protein